MIFIRWYADRHMTRWQSLWDDRHMRRWQCVYEANTSPSLVILQTTMHSPLPLETFCLTGPTITKVCNRVPLGGFKWPWDLVIWWLCWSQSVETPLVLKYIPTRPSLCRVWIRAVAGLEEQSFVRNCSSVGRAGRGQPSSSRCSNCDSEKSVAFEGVWRHTCLSVDFVSGRLLLVENGLLLKETVSEELTNIFKVGTFICSLQSWEIQFYMHHFKTNTHNYDHNIHRNIPQTFDGTMNSVTVGCNYRKATPPSSPYMNMQVHKMHTDTETYMYLHIHLIPKFFTTKDNVHLLKERSKQSTAEKPLAG